MKKTLIPLIVIMSLIFGCSKSDDTTFTEQEVTTVKVGAKENNAKSFSYTPNSVITEITVYYYNSTLVEQNLVRDSYSSQVGLTSYYRNGFYSEIWYINTTAGNLEYLFGPDVQSIGGDLNQTPPDDDDDDDDLGTGATYAIWHYTIADSNIY